MTLKEWKPDTPVKTGWTCASCKKLVELELPGKVIWAGGLGVPHASNQSVSENLKIWQEDLP